MIPVRVAHHRSEAMFFRVLEEFNFGLTKKVDGLHGVADQETCTPFVA